MITIMGQVADRENLNIEGLSCDVTKVMTASPRKISEILVDFTMPSGVKLSDKQKEVLKRAAHTCPVALSIHPDIQQKISFNF